ncbi:unnamed protein product [Gongylonema pulchrum]|uniref:ShKT domain-containing protein n=1 Tax=Gongylonema pulchrum TaxID=637853 RepID=A0A183E0P6_9BILA|nr:unnamed protein product [Gongylonema pulchrum]
MVKIAVDTCKDLDRQCFDIVAHDGSECLKSPFVKKNCPRTCVACGSIEKSNSLYHDIPFILQLCIVVSLTFRFLAFLVPFLLSL